MNTNETNKKILCLINDLHNYNNQTYAICKELAGHIQELIQNNSEENLREGMEAMLSLYNRNTDKQVRTAIENIALYKISTYVMLSPERKSLILAVPAAFRKIMNEQICHSGI